MFLYYYRKTYGNCLQSLMMTYKMMYNEELCLCRWHHNKVVDMSIHNRQELEVHIVLRFYIQNQNLDNSKVFHIVHRNNLVGKNI